jgi:hypothetical protein
MDRGPAGRHSPTADVSFQAVRTGRTSAVVLLAAAALLVSGCGEGASAGFTKGGPPAPAECVKDYNDDPSALTLGSHAYGTTHESRAAHVFRITSEENGLKESCAVIFAAADSDREYGILGAIEYPTGWDYTTQLSVTTQKRNEIQRLGAEQANVALESDGSLSAFK